MPAYLSLNTGALGLGDLSLDDKIRLASQHGFAGLDVSIGATDEDADALRQKLASAGLRPGTFGMPVNLYAPDADFDAGLQKLADLAPRAVRVGVLRTGCYMLCATKDRNPDEYRAWHLDRFRRLLAVLRPHNIELGIEFLGEHLLAKIGGHPFIYNLAGMRDLLRDLGPGAGVIFDVFHWHCSGGTPERLAEEVQGVPVTCIHLNDADPERTRLEQIDNERRLPGETGVIDSAAVMRVFNQLGYDGPMMVEPFKPWNQKLPALGPDAACKTVVDAVRRAIA